MNLQKLPKGKGVSLRLVIILLFIIGVIVSGTLLVVTYRLTDQYAETESATQDYLTCQENVYIVRDAIHELNDRARNFVVTGSQEEVIRYFNEVQVQRSIENARAEFQNYSLEEKTLKHLETAISLNEQMATIQSYAMRLAIEGYGYDVEKLPEALRGVELSGEDLAMTPEEQLDRALEMLFSKDYTLLKGQVDIRITLCEDALEEFMNGRHLSSSNELKRLLRHQRSLVLGMVFALLVVMVFVLTLVVYPIHALIRGIRGARAVNLRGSSEIKFLSETYNQMYEQMESANTRLSYEASHDALTGLYNRAAYEAIREEIGNRNIALLLVDVDLFKEVNDTYGHDIGDKVLVRVAHVIQDSFREADRVCRIGGDEFAVIMMDVTSYVTRVIRRKIEKASQILGAGDGDVPPVSISVGCAFSDRLQDGENLFKNADRALYKVKKNGRGNCGFYHEEFEDDADGTMPEA